MKPKSLVFAFVILGVSVLLTSFVFSDTAQTTVDVGNLGPQVGTPSATDPIDLNEGSDITVYCNTTINDTNGWEDIDEVNATLKTVQTPCTADPDNCYKNTSCTIGTGSSNSLDVNCSFSVLWYADSGDWYCNITANDSQGTSNYSSISTVTINSLVALDVNSSIGFGSLSIGQDSGNHTAQVNNTGNSQIDVRLNGTNMSCDTQGNITVGQLHYNTTSASDWTLMCALTETNTDTCSEIQSNFDLTDGASSNKDIYWILRVPSGVSGICTGYITFTAISG